MLLRFTCALCAVLCIAPAASAANHTTVTSYDELQTRLRLEPGQTYLAFMKNQIKPGLDAFDALIRNDPATRARNYSQLQRNLLAQGAGVAVEIDERNYIFNVGFLDGSQPQNDIRSGRSYGVGPSGKESDPSDLKYLGELEEYLKAEPQAAGDFIEAIMRVITDCDPSGWATLSEDGQIVATDFLAIYTAELDRHLMFGLRPKAFPWEIDLAATTFVSVFDAASGLLMQSGTLVRGSIRSWWARGPQGSGIGMTRRDRIALQKLIAREEAGSEETREIEKMIGDTAKDDVIQAVLEYLNSNDTPSAMADAGKLSGLMRDYLAHVQAHSSEIAAEE